jgi:DNA-binding beta-propeller fold protein YncE
LFHTTTTRYFYALSASINIGKISEQQNEEPKKSNVISRTEDLNSPNLRWKEQDTNAKWGGKGSGDGKFSTAAGIAVDSDGSVYVADMMYDRIQKLSNGTFITKWDSPGSDNGQLDFPIGIAVDPKGDVYVVDDGNSRLQVFSPVIQ